MSSSPEARNRASAAALVPPPPLQERVRLRCRARMPAPAPPSSAPKLRGEDLPAARSLAVQAPTRR